MAQIIDLETERQARDFEAFCHHALGHPLQAWQKEVFRALLVTEMQEPCPPELYGNGAYIDEASEISPEAWAQLGTETPNRD